MIKQTLVLTIGACGSGKTTYAKELTAKSPYTLVRLDRDEFRRMFNGNPRRKKHTEDLVKHSLNQALKFALKQGKSVIISDTNLSSKTRQAYKEIADQLGVETILAWFDVPLDELLRRNETRDHGLSIGIVKGMFKCYLNERHTDEPKEMVDLKYRKECEHARVGIVGKYTNKVGKVVEVIGFVPELGIIIADNGKVYSLDFFDRFKKVKS